MEVKGDGLAFRASPKWPLKELQILTLLHGLHFSASNLPLGAVPFFRQLISPTPPIGRLLQNPSARKKMFYVCRNLRKVVNKSFKNMLKMNILKLR